MCLTENALHKWYRLCQTALLNDFLSGSGAVDFDEFCLLMQRKIAMDTKQELFELFSVWDESGEGIIEANELRCLLNRIQVKLTKREIDSLVNQADTKKNGKIKFQGMLSKLLRLHRDANLVPSSLFPFLC